MYGDSKIQAVQWKQYHFPSTLQELGIWSFKLLNNTWFFIKIINLQIKDIKYKIREAINF